MATTNFETGTTITKEWLNDVDAAVYETLPDIITDVATNTANIATKATSGANTDIDSLQGPIEIRSSSGTKLFSTASTNTITTEADIASNDDFGISSKTNIALFIDSDNTATTNTFTVYTNAPGTTGATTLFTVKEDGEVTVPTKLTLDGITDINAVSVTSYTSESVNGNLCSGYTTPTLTIVSGITSVDPVAAWYWMRVGNMVLVHGQVNIDPSAASGPTSIEFRASLPIASAFGASRQLGGVAASANGDVIRIAADATNDAAVFTGTVNSVGLTSYSFNYSYVVA